MMNLNILEEAFDTKKKDLLYHINEIEKIILNCNTELEGNCIYIDKSLNKPNELVNKQKNLFNCGTIIEKRICEIGFNAGHSALLFILGSKCGNYEFDIFDIGEHSYTKLCLEYLKNIFNINFNYIEGDSTITIPNFIDLNKDKLDSYDVVHVDGGHSEYCIKNDLMNADKLVKINGIIIIDDTDAEQINKYVDFYLLSGGYEEIFMNNTYIYPHRIIKKISYTKNKIKTLIDVGSGRGKFIDQIKSIDQDIECHLFEPIKLIYDNLKTNNKFDKIYFNNLMVSNTCKKENFIYKDPMLSENNLVGTCVAYSLDPNRRNDIIINWPKENIESITLTKYIYNINKSIDVINIEVGGNEFEVLEGLINYLENTTNKPIIIVSLSWGINHPEWDTKCLPIYNNIINLDYKNSNYKNNTHTHKEIFIPI